jgi:hypothetical protein
MSSWSGPVLGAWLNARMLVLPARRAVALVSCSLAAVGISGCGSNGDAGTGTSGSTSTGTDGIALLNDAKLTPGGKPLTSGTVALTLSGTADAPKDKDVRRLGGKVALTVSADKLGAKGGVPPVKVSFDIDGTYTSADGKPGKAKYAGGLTYLGDQLYVNWKGKDYAFGTELTKQVGSMAGESLAKGGGDTSGLKEAAADPAKLLSTLDLDPGTWLEEARVSDGPMLDGVETVAISGQVDLKASAEDLRAGFKKLPAAFPDVPGLKRLQNMADLSDADVKEAQDAITTRELTIYLGTDDQVQRRVKLDIAGKVDATAVDLHLQLDTSKINRPQGLRAPNDAAPVTDLFLALQQDFPGLGGLLGG